METKIVCSVCDNNEFNILQLLWPGLINDWQLSPREAEYINRQQGQCCTRCGANLRSIALAKAMLNVLGVNAPLLALASSKPPTRILELNEAGSLTPVLRHFPNHVLAKYPEVDIHKMPYADGSFDIVLHSDTLEHVENPVHGLKECRRVLSPGGALCYTVPIVVGRMSRNRAGLSGSYHGGSGVGANDLLVHTEYGADAWTQVIEAGFSQVTLTAVDYPAAIAITARG
ncbi:methyltransferase domain-containing protein [Niveispirillum sp. SYP-B3756]|nr:methyltransferase domain-containing protein [Niveispirillum sp. SYP-B3756]